MLTQLIHDYTKALLAFLSASRECVPMDKRATLGKLMDSAMLCLTPTMIRFAGSPIVRHGKDNIVLIWGMLHKAESQGMDIALAREAYQSLMGYHNDLMDVLKARDASRDRVCALSLN